MGKQLVECTQDLYWASGLPPRYTETTKPEYYPGKTQLGRVLQSVREDLVREDLVREDLIREAVQLALIDPDSHRDVNFPSSVASDEQSDISLALIMFAHWMNS